ncbi:MAG: hypothetical protein FWE24_05055 [Defluviitaleaceae bacterium]|nr:hypothetical protein [Defluviitaleaceae bacterium]
MIFGLGIGIVSVAFVFFIALRAVNPVPEVIIETGYISDDEVIERARALGMITIRELPDENVSERAAYDLLMEAYQEEFENLMAHNLELTRMLEELGVSIEDINITLSGAYEAALSHTTPSIGAYTEITIPFGLSAYAIAELFFESGLVESVDSFNDFIALNDMTTTLMEGTHQIPEGAAHAEILSIISTWTEE